MSYQTLYHEQLLDYYKHPRNKGTIENPDIFSGVFNPSCGDQVSIQAMVVDNKMDKIMFQAKGCVISVATASLITEFVRGKFVDEVLALDAKSVLQLVKLELGPNRVRCALLALEALQNGIKEYRVKQGETSS
jgi:nitrogen fixation NifU-like protein